MTPAFLIDPPEPRCERPVDRHDVPGRAPSRIADLRRMVELRRKVEAELHPAEPVTAHRPDGSQVEFADIAEAARIVGVPAERIRDAIATGQKRAGMGWSKPGGHWEPRERYGRGVERLDASGAVRGWYSSGQAAARVFAVSRSSICHAIQQGSLCGGFKWRRADKKESPEKSGLLCCADQVCTPNPKP